MRLIWVVFWLKVKAKWCYFMNKFSESGVLLSKCYRFFSKMCRGLNSFL